MKKWACIVFEPSIEIKKAFESEREAKNYWTGERLYVYPIGEWKAYPTNRPGSLARFFKIQDNLEIKTMNI
jgi:hypothetical protein